MEAAILVLSVLVSAAIGLFVVIRNPRHIVNRIYGLLTFTLMVFAVANYLSLQTTERLQYIRIVIACSTTLVTLLYYLIIFLEKPDRKLGRGLKGIGYLSGIIAVLDFTPIVFSGLTTGANPVPVPGVAAPLFVLHLVTFLGIGFSLLFRRVIRTRGKKRSQYAYLLIGISPMFALSPLTGFVMPIVLKDASLVFLSPIYTTFFVCFVGYAIIRHKLFDIHFFVVRAGAYLTTLFTVTILIVAPIVAISGQLLDLQLSMKEFVGAVLLGTAALYALQYLRQIFDKLTSKIFYRHYYDPQDVLDRLSNVLVRTADITELRTQTAAILQDALKPGQFHYALFADKSSDESRLAKRIRHLEVMNSNILDLDEIAPQGNSHALEILRGKGIALIIRLRTTHEDLGYIILGHKQSGESYVDRDKRLLSVAADEIAISMQNALRFEEIQQFNETLKQRVATATHRLSETNKKLRLMDQTKDDFISMASHQLRTPLTSVKGYVSMVLDGDAGKITPLQRKLLNQSFISSQRMVYLISDLLNVSRLRTGKFIIEPNPCNLAKVIKDEIEQLQETAKGRNLELTYNKPEHFPTLMLDETKVRQVIMNFIDNAIYYTPSGGHISVNLIDKPKTVEFTVTDDGIGVSKDEQHHLFTKFFRAQNAKRARPDGTGLGLFMAKKVVIAQGGAIIFKSQENKGSTFGFTFAKEKLKDAHSTPVEITEAA